MVKSARTVSAVAIAASGDDTVVSLASLFLACAVDSLDEEEDEGAAESRSKHPSASGSTASSSSSLFTGEEEEVCRADILASAVASFFDST